MSEWEIGVTAPPFHVYCRSTTVPYFDDGLGSIGGRAARGDDGKTVIHGQWCKLYSGWKACYTHEQ